MTTYTFFAHFIFAVVSSAVSTRFRYLVELNWSRMMPPPGLQIYLPHLAPLMFAS